MGDCRRRAASDVIVGNGFRLVYFVSHGGWRPGFSHVYGHSCGQGGACPSADAAESGSGHLSFQVQVSIQLVPETPGFGRIKGTPAVCRSVPVFSVEEPSDGGRGKPPRGFKKKKKKKKKKS